MNPSEIKAFLIEQQRMFLTQAVALMEGNSLRTELLAHVSKLRDVLFYIEELERKGTQ